MPETIDPREEYPEGSFCTFTDEQTSETTDSRDLMLFLRSVEINDPIARRHEVDVPGMDNTLDLTEALGGVYFSRREITLTFACINYTTQRFLSLASTLRNMFDGRVMHVTLSSDLAYYWRGRCQLEASRPSMEHTEITITMDADAHKYSIYSSYEAWRWDPFSFVDGVVTQQDDVILEDGETKSVELPIDPARGKPILWLNSGASGSVSARLSTDKEWHALRSGKNTLPEIRMNDRAEVTLMLRGTGTVGVEYRIGSL